MLLTHRSTRWGVLDVVRATTIRCHLHVFVQLSRQAARLPYSSCTICLLWCARLVEQLHWLPHDRATADTTEATAAVPLVLAADVALSTAFAFFAARRALSAALRAAAKAVAMKEGEDGLSLHFRPAQPGGRVSK
jgi:hypothetical protein